MQTVQKLQKGFTLIELMIVVAIIGILAAVALPAYQDYIAKSKVTSIYATMAAGKSAMFDRYGEIGSMPTANALARTGIEEVGSSSISFFNTVNSMIPDSLSAAAYVRTDATTGTWTVTLDRINGNINGATLDLVYADAGGTLSFTCSAAASVIAVPNKYLPKECQA